MATNEKKKVMGYDPLAWLGQEADDEIEDEVITETESHSQVEDLEPETEQALIDCAKIDFDQVTEVPSTESVSFDDALALANSEVNMSDVADLSNESISVVSEGADNIEPVIELDTTLTIQNVVKLYEKIKQSYSAYTAIEINASHVSSIDTSTLQLLVALKKDAVKKQKTVVFIEPSRRFIESAELLGLLEILDVEA
jgi:anti-anti-sigma regulatory factor